jgi:CheY-like chemotaxis protein
LISTFERALTRLLENTIRQTKQNINMTSAKKILIVEDEIILAFVIRKYLKTKGYQVLDTVRTGHKAIDAARRENPDLILMDITIDGEMDGVEAMEEIRKFSDVPVIYLSGSSEPSTRKRAAKTSMTAFLIKPVEDYDLEHILEQLFVQQVQIDTSAL